MANNIIIVTDALKGSWDGSEKLFGFNTDTSELIKLQPLATHYLSYPSNRHVVVGVIEKNSILAAKAGFS